MTGVDVRLVPLAEARQVLAEVIRGAQAGNSLAPVTVVVPSNLVGLDTRRWLARERAVVNVRFVVIERLAELVAARRLAGRGKRPRSRWTWVELLREAAARQGGALAARANHPATLRRLASLAVELRAAPGVRERLEGDSEPLVAEAARIIGTAEAKAADLYDDHDLLVEAAQAFRQGDPATREVGHVVLYLPARVTAAVADLAKAAAGSGCTVILGLTGDAEVDSAARRWIELLGNGATTETRVALRLPERLASLPDPEEEVRYAVRRVWALAKGGVPLHRVAILYGNAEQYASLVHDRLTASGTPFNGQGPRRLADSLAGRAVLGMLRAARREWRRDAVIDWVTSAPLQMELEGGKRIEIPGHEWDLLSREAGVVRDLRDWEKSPDALAGLLDARINGGWLSAEEAERRKAAAKAMAKFVGEGATLVGEAGGTRDVAAWAAVAREVLERWLPRDVVARVPSGAASRQRDDAELAAYDEVVRVLDAMHGAGAGGHRLSLEEFEATLREALGVAGGRNGQLGEGVFTGSVAEAAGMAFEHVFILGMAERVYPPQPGDDPLLPERVRARLDGAVARANERELEERRAYLSVVGMATTVTLTVPRATLRDQRPALPSRWFFEAAAALHGAPVFVNDLERWVADGGDRPAWLDVVASFPAWVMTGDVFGEAAERDLAEVCRAEGTPREHALLQTLGVADGIEARAARTRASAMGSIGPWTGYAGELVADPEREYSATALETLTRCPFRFFLEQELRLSEVEKPEELDTIDPATRGSLLHEVLEEFVNEVKTRRGTDGIEGAWREDDRKLLVEIGDRKFEEFERRGVTGRPAAWQARRQQLRQDLERFLDEDERWRGKLGASIREAELAFGRRFGREPLVLELGDDRALRVAGKADRVDEGRDGSLVVIDYKSGKTEPFEQEGGSGLAAKKGGWLLQLPIYARAARGDGNETPVRAVYWFVSEEGGFKRIEVELDGETDATFREVVREAIAVRDRGLFPMNPGKPSSWGSWENCGFCPFERVCPAGDRDIVAERLHQDARLARFRDLVLRNAAGTPAGGAGGSGGKVGP